MSVAGLPTLNPDAIRLASHWTILGEKALLVCGDAYSIRPTLGWFDADVFDPPYLINTSGGGVFRDRRRTMDEIAEAGIDKGFDHSIINPMLSGSVVSFCHNDQLASLVPFLDGVFHRYAVCAWLKSNPMPVANKHYRPDAEPYIHAWNQGFEPQGSMSEKRRFVVSGSDRSLKRQFQHPTIKPPKVMDKILANIAGETVCDPFMGTGSTGVAAIKAGKLFVGIERKRDWFNAAVLRISHAIEEADND